MPQIKKEYNSNNPHPVDKHAGEVLRRLRMVNNFTQQDVADLLDCTFQQIQKYETGVNRLQASKLDILRREFMVTADYFLPTTEGLNNTFMNISKDDLMKMSEEELKLRRKISKIQISE